MKLIMGLLLVVAVALWLRRALAHHSKKRSSHDGSVAAEHVRAYIVQHYSPNRVELVKKLRQAFPSMTMHQANAAVTAFEAEKHRVSNP